jgi:hypothetical protein
MTSTTFTGIVINAVASGSTGGTLSAATTVNSGPILPGQIQQSGVTKSNTVGAQAIVTTTGAQTIGIYWNTSAGTASANQRTLTLVQIA